jgi:hypothetical protein
MRTRFWLTVQTLPLARSLQLLGEKYEPAEGLCRV